MTKSYQVSWTESTTYTIQVEAQSKDEAQVKAFEEYDHEWDAKPKVDPNSINVYEF